MAVVFSLCRNLGIRTPIRSFTNQNNHNRPIQLVQARKINTPQYLRNETRNRCAVRSAHCCGNTGRSVIVNSFSSVLASVSFAILLYTLLVEFYRMWGKSLSGFKEFNFEVAASFFKGKGWTSRQKCKGYKFFLEGYIHEIWTEDFTIKGRCYKSQKKNDKPHQMYMLFEQTPTLNLRQVHCTCEAGNSQSCSHVVGFAYLLQDLVLRQLNVVPDDNISCTSEPMVWNKPRGKKIEAEKVSEAIFQKPTNITRKKKPVQSTLFDSRTSSVRKVTNSEIQVVKEKLNLIDERIPFAYILRQNQEAEAKLLNGIEVPLGSTLHHQLDTTYPKEINNHGLQLPLLDSEIQNIFLCIPPIQISEFSEMTFKTASEIEQNTQRQADCSLWHTERKKRFTASKFGTLFKRKKAIDEKFLRSIVKGLDISMLPHVRHGRQFEGVAKMKYTTLTGRQVFDCGLIIHPYGSHTAASPDGIIFDQNYGYGVLETKCPSGKRYKSLNEACKVAAFCLKSNQAGEIKLKRSHDYFYQIQGQMLISGTRWCDFVVYFSDSDELFVERIDLDVELSTIMYMKLTEMYRQHVVPIYNAIINK